MKLINRNTGIVFIWVAILIIIVHGIIPHHHHFGFEEQHRACKILSNESKCCDHENVVLIAFHHETGKNEQCNKCHFKTDFIIRDIKIKLDKNIHKGIEYNILHSKNIIFTFVIFNENPPQYLINQSSTRAPPTKC